LTDLVFGFQRKPRETTGKKGKQRKSKENHRIHPAPNEKKPEETERNRRKPKEIKGYLDHEIANDN